MDVCTILYILLVPRLCSTLTQLQCINIYIYIQYRSEASKHAPPDVISGSVPIPVQVPTVAQPHSDRIAGGANVVLASGGTQFSTGDHGIQQQEGLQGNNSTSSVLNTIELQDDLSRLQSIPQYQTTPRKLLTTIRGTINDVTDTDTAANSIGQSIMHTSIYNNILVLTSFQI